MTEETKVYGKTRFRAYDSVMEALANEKYSIASIIEEMRVDVARQRLSRMGFAMLLHAVYTMPISTLEVERHVADLGAASRGYEDLVGDHRRREEAVSGHLHASRRHLENDRDVRAEALDRLPVRPPHRAEGVDYFRSHGHLH